MCKIIKRFEGEIQNHRENFYKIGFFTCVIVYGVWLLLTIYWHSTDHLYLTTALIAIPSLLVAVVTFLYVLLTRQLVITNQSLFDAQTEPIVIAYLSAEQRQYFKVIYLIIENVGLGIAKNVKFNVSRYGLKTPFGILDENSAIQNGIPMLGPKQRMRITLEVGFSLIFQITIHYQNQIGINKGPHSFDLDPTITIDS